MASDIQTIKEETDITEEEARRLPHLRTGDVFISEALRDGLYLQELEQLTPPAPYRKPFDELITDQKQKMKILQYY